LAQFFVENCSRFTDSSKLSDVDDSRKEFPRGGSDLAEIFSLYLPRFNILGIILASGMIRNINR